MDLFGYKTKESLLDHYSDYRRIEREQIMLRPIAEGEYASLETKYRSKPMVFKSREGIGFIISLVFTVFSLKYCAEEFINGGKDPYMNLLIFGTLDLFSVLLFGLITLSNLDRIVRSDSLVAAGEWSR